VKISNGISAGNIVTIAMLLVAIIFGWSTMSSDISSLKSEIGEKADKDVVEVKFEYIQQELSEIKEMLRDGKGNK
tara:strand:- start:51 stop:275 length:225 start_codon:yes stop_codon:yes gene_type:complete